MAEHDDAPKLVDKTEAEIAEIVRLIRESSLSDSIKEFVVGCIESALWLPRLLQKKNISISRLKRMIFGKGYFNTKKKEKLKEKRDDLNTPPKEDSDSPPSSKISASPMGSTPENGSSNSSENNLLSRKEKKVKNHGRMPHSIYEEFTKGYLKLDLKMGDLCPYGCGGKLFSQDPGIIVRVYGQNFAHVWKYDLEKLRCGLCGSIVSPEIPSELGKEKYHTSFKSVLALQKYYVAVPFYRQEYFQKLIGFPLPDSTQWHLVEQVANCGYPVFSVLKELCANDQRINNDDTSVKILEVISDLKKSSGTSRTGMFTTGIIGEHEGHKIALFLNGTKHAGENLADILKNRDLKSSPIIQMCDALNRNIPKGISTIVCNCLGHAFRKFEELVDFFPSVCLSVMKELGRVYDHEEKTQNMTAAERLKYHQTHSRPILEALYQYVTQQFSHRLVEPNSELGKALLYLKNHWVKLTRFLSVPGAFLDNNIVERALKIAIRNRKSAMFYRTRYSAGIGGMLTSLIYTCHLAGENAFHYLTALQQYKKEVLFSPRQWLPWNYLKTIGERGIATLGDAKVRGRSPPLDCLVATR